jgi:hypothetical protein
MSGFQYDTRSTSQSTDRTSSSATFALSFADSLRSSATSFSSFGNYGQPLAYSERSNVAQSGNYRDSVQMMDFPPQEMYETDIIPSALPHTGSGMFVTAEQANQPEGTLYSSGSIVWPCLDPAHKDIKPIGRKGDWKRHMDTFHKPGELAWACQSPECGLWFDTEAAFHQHHRKSHNCRKCPHANESRILALPKQAFPCGVSPCKYLSTSWNDWRDHVAEHISHGTSIDDWHYNTEFANLLRRKEIDFLWRSHVERELGSAHVDHFEFRWDPKDTTHLKRHLEYDSLQEGAEQLIFQVFAAATSMRPRTEFEELLSQPANGSSTKGHPVNSTDMSNSSTYNGPPYSQYPEVGFSISDIEQSAAFDVAIDKSQQPPTYCFTNDQTHSQAVPDYNFPPATNSGHYAYNASTLVPEPNQLQRSQQNPATLVVNSPLAGDIYVFNIPEDPTAAYGLPPDNAIRVPRHTRSKSSLYTRFSNFISKTKAGHSRSGSTYSGQSSGGSQD